MVIQLLAMPPVDCRCTASSSVVTSDPSELCGNTTCMVLNNISVQVTDAKCVIGGVDCAATSTGRCELSVTASAMAVDPCCCDGSNGYYVNGGTFVPMGQSTIVSRSADTGCNNNGATASLKMSCTPTSAALAESTYSLSCSNCRR